MPSRVLVCTCDAPPWGVRVDKLNEIKEPTRTRFFVSPLCSGWTHSLTRKTASPSTGARIPSRSARVMAPWSQAGGPASCADIERARGTAPNAFAAPDGRPTEPLGRATVPPPALARPAASGCSGKGHEPCVDSSRKGTGSVSGPAGNTAAALVRGEPEPEPAACPGGRRGKGAKLSLGDAAVAVGAGGPCPCGCPCGAAAWALVAVVIAWPTSTLSRLGLYLSAALPAEPWDPTRAPSLVLLRAVAWRRTWRAPRARATGNVRQTTRSRTRPTQQSCTLPQRLRRHGCGGRAASGAAVTKPGGEARRGEAARRSPRGLWNASSPSPRPALRLRR